MGISKATVLFKNKSKKDILTNQSLWGLMALSRQAEGGITSEAQSRCQPVTTDLTHGVFVSRGYKCFQPHASELFISWFTQKSF